MIFVHLLGVLISYIENIWNTSYIDLITVGENMRSFRGLIFRHRIKI